MGAVGRADRADWRERRVATGVRRPRRGGPSRRPRAQSAAHACIDGQLAADSRLPGLWQARIEQLAEQLAEMGDPLPDAPGARAGVQPRFPPAGLLPISAVNLDVLPLNLASEVLQSRFFPQGFELDAAPVPIPQLDVAIREAAPLAAIDFSAAERVRRAGAGDAGVVRAAAALRGDRRRGIPADASIGSCSCDRGHWARVRDFATAWPPLTGAITGTTPEVPAA